MATFFDSTRKITNDQQYMHYTPFFNFFEVDQTKKNQNKPSKPVNISTSVF